MQQNESILRLRDVCQITGASQSTIYRSVAAGDFPAPIKVGGRTRWVQSEVQDYLQRTIADARGNAAAGS